MSDRDTLARLLFIQRHPLALADRARRWDQQMLMEHEPIDAYREADAILASDWLAAHDRQVCSDHAGVALDIAAERDRLAALVERLQGQRDDEDAEHSRVLEEAQGEIARLRDEAESNQSAYLHAAEGRSEAEDEVKRLQTYIDSQPYPSDLADAEAERDRLAVTLEKVRALADEWAEMAVNHSSPVASVNIGHRADALHAILDSSARGVDGEEVGTPIVSTADLDAADHRGARP